MHVLWSTLSQCHSPQCATAHSVPGAVTACGCGLTAQRCLELLLSLQERRVVIDRFSTACLKMRAAGALTGTSAVTHCQWQVAVTSWHLETLPFVARTQHPHILHLTATAMLFEVAPRLKGVCDQGRDTFSYRPCHRHAGVTAAILLRKAAKQTSLTYHSVRYHDQKHFTRQRAQLDKWLSVVRYLNVGSPYSRNCFWCKFV